MTSLFYGTTSAITALLVLMTPLLFSRTTTFIHAQQQQVAVVSERQILLELYQATGGSSSWNNQYGWNDNSKNICSWYGVYCVSETAPVAATDDTLYNTTMSAATDDGMSTRQRQRNLLFTPTTTTTAPTTTSATTNNNSYVVIGLDLSSNHLVGQTPSSLWQLPKLHYLALSWNDQLVVDATNIEQATHLKELHLPGTATSISFLASQLVPLASSLTSLHASAVSPDLSTTTIPTGLWSLTELRSLHLGNCSLLGTIDSTTLGMLSHLQELDLYHNQLTGPLPTEGLSLLTDLRLLVLADNGLHGPLPNEATAFTWPRTLEYMYLEHNRFTGPLPSFRTLTQLKLLTLQENQLSSTIPFDFLAGLANETATLHQNSSTIMVNLAGNLLTGTVPATLTKLSNVPMVWDFADNQFTDVDKLLCTMDQWMQGQVANYGCYALLCPRGTYHPLGHESRQGGTCWSCPSNTRFLGSTTCLDQAQDLDILKALYDGTQGANWINQDGWNTANGPATTNFCTWYGITCWNLGDARDGRVRAIRLPFNNLVGTLPDVVFQLAQMTLLDVSSNTFLTVSLDQIQSSPHLQVLNIGHTNTNDFTGLTQVNGMFHHLLADHLPLIGPLPSQVLSLKNLKTLSLASCQLTGTLPLALGALTDLEELYLYDNELGGSLANSAMTQMTSLRIVSLAQNKLTGTIPDVSAWTNLQALSMYDQITKGGGVIGALPAFDTQTDLTSLQLARNQLSGTVPSTLLSSARANTSLVVDLSYNTLTGTVPGSLGRFNQMNIYLEGNLFTHLDTSLCLVGDWMSGAVAAFGCSGILCPASSTGGRQQFDDLTCTQCPRDPKHLLGQTECGSTSGSVSWTSPNGSTQQDILRSLYTSCGGKDWHYQNNWNDTSTSVCDWYGIGCDETESVTSIALGFNRLTGSVPSEIFFLPQLKRVSLFANALSFSFEGIENAQNLNELILDETGLTSLAGVGKAAELRQLNVRFNQLAGPIPTELSQLTNIQALGLSGNALTSSVPTWFSQLTLLQDLLLSNNQLTGTLYDFQGLPYLQYLDFSDNHLIGTVPQNFLPSLAADQSVFVDLSKNYLSGTLSAELAAKGKGRAIDLQDNQIVAIDASLCSASQFECNGILCPIGTSNAQGRQTNANTPCQPCPKATFMGSTLCGNQSSAKRVEGVWLLLGVLGIAQIWAIHAWIQ